MGDSVENEVSRTLPDTITIPEINGEMVHLRPATLADCAIMDELEAYYNASRITGKDEAAERALVHTWVGRSVAWSQGLSSHESGVGDPESRRTIAWAVVADPTGELEPKDGKVIGMIFLIDIDGWAKSARIQIMLGKDYRGRGYSRDAMPRVMTYGFAWAPAGLGMHRIWVAVPEKNTRSLSVYQSLGFVLEGTSRHALWDDADQRYQDQIVLGTLVDEFDPIRSLDAFGMHLIEDNPGVREALAAREHSMSIMRDKVAQQLRNQQAQSLKPNTEESDQGTASGNTSDAATNTVLNQAQAVQEGQQTDSVEATVYADSAQAQHGATDTSHQSGTSQLEHTVQAQAALDAAHDKRSMQERESNANHDAPESSKLTKAGNAETARHTAGLHAADQSAEQVPNKHGQQDADAVADSDADAQHNTKGGSSWSYADKTATHSKRAWWRNLGKGRTRENNE